MADEAEKLLEDELAQQLDEQKTSLDLIQAALREDPANEELLQVFCELREAVEASESGLLHLKQSRLLRHVDQLAAAPSHDVLIGEGMMTNDITATMPGFNQDAQNRLHDEGAAFTPQVGSICSFLHVDGRWYQGKVLDIHTRLSQDNSNDHLSNVSENDTGWLISRCSAATSMSSKNQLALVAFLHPTKESMQICEHFLRDTCRFGNSCRKSHGVLMPLASLDSPSATVDAFTTSLGTTVLAKDEQTGLWRKAELHGLDKARQQVHVTFTDRGGQVSLSPRHVFVPVESNAQRELTDDDEDDYERTASGQFADNQDNGCEDEEIEDDAFCVASFLDVSRMVEAGVQTQTQTFASWEQHTRGVASKMMVAMGFRMGSGLGKTGEGMKVPLPVRVLPPKLSLDFAKPDSHDNQIGKKRRRGGQRVQAKKKAAEAREINQAVPTSDVFDFINHQLSGKDSSKTYQQLSGAKTEHSASSQSFRPRSQTTKDKNQGGTSGHRQELVKHENKVTELSAKVAKLQEMAARNRGDKVVLAAIMKKLALAKSDLATAQSKQSSMHSEVLKVEKEKKWLKF